MTTPARHTSCPQCARSVRSLRRSPGVVAAYPCCCWLTPGQARAVAADHRRLNPQEPR